ncbi:hypothetical protein BWQ96_05445 [Gracilariopsis chorda]|uniref:Uncharacterized protein n=1 Tax=Gracilariopsis chorda TaxID=448386 RepID=A0A2V3IRN0_9FLOR|nr:hypothetical protein BWQ96_05445 [Gracilariopsis chorda]|eukprot:PXF44775.1 hypothetical protein BWQ96_05445 [Gracilariopsis chorda]
MHMKVGTKGLDEGYDPHMQDVCKLLKDTWNSISEKTIAQCWTKADIFLRSIQSILIMLHGKVKKRDKQVDDSGVAEIVELLSRIGLDDDDDAIPDPELFNV